MAGSGERKAVLVTANSAGCSFGVRVTPRAGRSGIAGEHDGALAVRLTAPPVEGAANRALLALLADVLRVPKRAVTIASGAAGRQKRVRVEGLTAETCSKRLAELLRASSRL